MKKKLLLAAILVSSTTTVAAGELYLRVGLLLNPNQFETGRNDASLSNPVATIGWDTSITRLRPTQDLRFYIEHQSGLTTGEFHSGRNELGLEVRFD